jgi:Family of unknown function (DUF5946)
MSSATATTVCPGCKAELPRSGWTGGSDRLHASAECHEVASGVLGYETEHLAALGHLHQLRIDAYGAQHCGPRTPAINTVFALNGLYMFFEHGGSGLDVRTAHTIMANMRTPWPKLTAPEQVGDLTAYDVYRLAISGARVDEVADLMVAWAEQAWNAWPDADRDVVRRLTDALVPRRYYRR